MLPTLVVYYVETNLICFLFMSFIMYSYIHESRGLAEAKWFISSLVTVQLYCIADVLSALFKGSMLPGARAVLWCSNTVYITIPLVLIILWNNYISAHMRPHWQAGKVFRQLDLTISAVSLLICGWAVSTPLTHSIFFLDEANGYHRTVGAYLVPAYAYLFMIYSTVKLRFIHNRTESLQVRHDANVLSLFTLPCVLFSLIQVLLYGTTVSQVGFTMGLMIVYIVRQQNKISRDELTGLNNRREYKYALDRLSRSSGTAMIAMIDVDDFKSINDTYGHAEGDIALKAVAMILKQVCSQRSQFGSLALYRYGGDEFVMLSAAPGSEQIPDQLLQAIDAQTESWNARSGKPYALHLSVGLASGTYTGKGITRLVEAADREMYTRKAARKHN